MFCAKIIKSNNDSNSYNIISYDISLSEGSLLLKLISDKEEIIYEIRKDDRENDINLIYKFILSELQGAEKGNKVFLIDEYLERLYINIGEEISSRRQFTAIKR